jgi:hypothetical protein
MSEGRVHRHLKALLRHEYSSIFIKLTKLSNLRKFLLNVATFTDAVSQWYSTFFVLVPPDIISLQLCTPKVVGT